VVLTPEGEEKAPAPTVLYQAADDALRRAKSEGRDRSVGAAM
jgi:PleD family two-component response regulator